MAGLNNLEYDIITILQNKAQAIAAYDKYVSDTADHGNAEARRLFEDFKRQDEKDVERLRELLTGVLGKSATASSGRR